MTYIANKLSFAIILTWILGDRLEILLMGRGIGVLASAMCVCCLSGFHFAPYPWEPIMFLARRNGINYTCLRFSRGFHTLTSQSFGIPTLLLFYRLHPPQREITCKLLTTSGHVFSRRCIPIRTIISRGITSRRLTPASSARSGSNVLLHSR
jgi:hypothetical protein